MCLHHLMQSNFLAQILNTSRTHVPEGGVFRIQPNIFNEVLLFYCLRKSPRLHKNEVFHLKLQKTVDLVIFTEEILNEKLHVLCSAIINLLTRS